MADVTQGGKNLPDYSTVLWDSGKPYWKTANGAKLYIPPAVAMSMFDDQKAVDWAKSQGYFIPGGREAVQAGTATPQMASQSGGIFHTTGTWDSSTGSFEHSIDWGNILTIAVAGAIAAPFVVGALSGGAVAGADVGATATVPEVGALGDVGLSATVPELGATAGTAATTAPVAAAAAAPEAVAPTTLASVGTSATTPVAAESGATTGLTSGAGLPGQVAAPTVGDLATTSSAIPGIADASAIPASAPTGLSSVGQNLLKAGIPAAANIVGNVLQKNAISDATKAQVDGQEKALAAEKQASERAIGILSPWTSVGSAAINNLGQLLRLTPQNSVQGSMPVTAAQQSSANNFVPSAVAASPTASQVPQGPGPYAADWPTMRGPDGSMRKVSPQQVPSAIKAGAQMVNA